MTVGDEALLRYLAEEGDQRERDATHAQVEGSPTLARRLDELRAELDSWTKHLRHAGPVPRARGGDLAGGPLPADTIPGYSILAEVGRGGQGVVYRALQVDTGRLVALKLLRDGPLASDDTLRRFRREVEIAAGLDHDGIVTVYEAGETPQGRQYVAMELVEGRRLDRHVEAAEPDFRARVELVLQVATAIEHAHRKGVIHLDLKPSNVVVDGEGVAKVLDFGLARSIQAQDPTQTLSLALA
ncbi:MAG: serine/threonine-protein kinase, partial [Planctomycetota bacterium]|nr:serine/threonine-protein kinase [Planctomycetota bacterium]